MSEERETTRWFVYTGAEYYPEGCVVEASTAEEAVERAKYGPDDEEVLVFPWEALAWSANAAPRLLDESAPTGERRMSL